MAGLKAQVVKIVDHTKNAGKIEWIVQQVNAGTIVQNIPFEATFSFENISEKPVKITNVTSTCHCTVPQWTPDPIPPGQIGKIKIVFDAEQEGDFYKIMKIHTNLDPDQGVPVVIRGKVVKPSVEPSKN